MASPSTQTVRVPEQEPVKAQETSASQPVSRQPEVDRQKYAIKLMTPIPL